MLRPAMERPVPLVQGATLLQRHKAAGPVATLTSGFLVSALIAFAGVAFIGAAFGLAFLPWDARIIAAIVLCSGMIVADLLTIKGNERACKLSLRRQTPKALEDRYGPYLGPMMWGLDAGLASTTIRVSAVTWLVFGLTALQLAPWWIGAAYGLGFCLPLATATLLLPWRPNHKFGEPMWVQHALSALLRAVQIGCVVALIVFGVALWTSVLTTG